MKKVIPQVVTWECDRCHAESTAALPEVVIIPSRDHYGSECAAPARYELCRKCESEASDWVAKRGNYKSPRPSIPPEALCYFKDGDQWCCVKGDFVDLQESEAGFGPTPTDAAADLDNNISIARLKAVMPVEPKP